MKKLLFYSSVLLPLNGENWLDLQYAKLKNNHISLSEKEIVIKVDQSASPLFYHFEKLQPIKKIEVLGSVEISKPIALGIDDAYFQIGLIEKGDFKPGWLIRKFLPDWLLTLVEKNKDKDYGVGNIYFYGVAESDESSKSSSTKIQSIELKFKDVAKMDGSGSFHLRADIDAKGPFAGLWIRADGDDGKAIFNVKIKEIKLY